MSASESDPRDEADRAAECAFRAALIDGAGLPEASARAALRGARTLRRLCAPSPPALVLTPGLLQLAACAHRATGPDARGRGYSLSDEVLVEISRVVDERIREAFGGCLQRQLH